MAVTALHSVIMVFWKETAFPLWRAMDRYHYYTCRDWSDTITKSCKGTVQTALSHITCLQSHQQ